MQIGSETITIDGVKFLVIEHGGPEDSPQVTAEEIILNGDSLGFCALDEAQPSGYRITDKIGLPVGTGYTFVSREQAIRQIVKDNSNRSLDCEAVLDEWRALETRLAYGPKRGGLREPKGGRPLKPVEEKYQQYPLKLPPDLIEWLEANVENKNGFIVEAIRRLIDEAHARESARRELAAHDEAMRRDEPGQ